MVEVLDSGYHITIQDRGRTGFSKYGVPLSGCMDYISSNNANSIIGNSIDEPVFEIAMMGGKFLFTEEVDICISGAVFEVKLNNNSIVNNTIIRVQKGDILNFGKALKGFRIYLAISGGFDSELILKSRSYFENITSSSVVKKGDRFNLLRNKTKPSNCINYPELIFENIIEVSRGPEFNLISGNDSKLLKEQFFTVSSNNRMGYFFKNGLSSNNFSIITSPVIPGTIQLTPSGKMIALMKDGQVTGGYPRILQMNHNSISILSQKKQGDNIRFKLVNLS